TQKFNIPFLIPYAAHAEKMCDLEQVTSSQAQQMGYPNGCLFKRIEAQLRHQAKPGGVPPNRGSKLSH
ncbi:23046_t:CDS:2, partial [Dentiscutata erythropus]